MIEEILKKYKPKELNVEELKKDRIILTDTYSWRDFRNCAKEIEQAVKEKMQKLLRNWII